MEPGNTLAVMGPSGSGKTTFLNTLADRISSGVVDGENLVVGGALRGPVSQKQKLFKNYMNYLKII